MPWTMRIETNGDDVAVEGNPGELVQVLDRLDQVTGGYLVEAISAMPGEGGGIVHIPYASDPMFANAPGRHIEVLVVVPYDQNALRGVLRRVADAGIKIRFLYGCPNPAGVQG